MKADWDIFCSVVDNYGDIGVTWRLARQLVAEHGQNVRLWVDDLPAFMRLCPVAQDLEQQHLAGVQVCRWSKDCTASDPAQVVIEAFACQLPEGYVQRMAQKNMPPLWINLEYLSAEDWVEGCHGLPSMQAHGLRKYFYFPGFTAQTGGLLREQDVVGQAQRFSVERAAQSEFWRSLGVDKPDAERVFSLFCYEQADLPSWLEALAIGQEKTLLLVPEGRVLGDVERYLGQPLVFGESQQRGQLRIQLLPFMEQGGYDRLLWACDFNVVRGEDSLLRGLWAGKPMLWDIYKQAEQAHLEKLGAFFSRYSEGLSPSAQEAVQGFYWAWNQAQGVQEAWQRLQLHWAEWVDYAPAQARRMAQEPDLASGLVQFCADWL